MNRWKAFGTHLLLSIVVIGGIATAAFLLWYPQALHRVAGLDRILLVMLVIDLTVGPLLTLILYKPGKRGLKFDLTVVVLCQVAFLAYGLNILRQERPVFLVGTPDMFTLAFATEIADADLAHASQPQWRRLSWTGPDLVGTRMPQDSAARSAIIEALMAGGAGIERNPRHYLDYAAVAPDLLRIATPAAGDGSIPQADLRAAGLPVEQLRVVPVGSRRGHGRMLVQAHTGRPLRVIAP